MRFHPFYYRYPKGIPLSDTKIIFSMVGVGKVHKPNKQVLKDIYLSFYYGAKIGVLGLNGAGKSTLLRIIAGVDTDYLGTIQAQKGITFGYLPQEPSVFRKLSVEDNIKAVLEMTRLSKAEQRDKLESLIDEFNLHHVRKGLGDTLSGGERRRTEIARALASDPKFILLDEPFAGIDPIAVEDIQVIVEQLKYKNIGILITDHNVQETLSITDRAYLLYDGHILKSGTAEELAEDPQVRKLYLGQNFELRKRQTTFTGNENS